MSPAVSRTTTARWSTDRDGRPVPGRQDVADHRAAAGRPAAAGGHPGVDAGDRHGDPEAARPAPPRAGRRAARRRVRPRRARRLRRSSSPSSCCSTRACPAPASSCSCWTTRAAGWTRSTARPSGRRSGRSASGSWSRPACCIVPIDAAVLMEATAASHLRAVPTILATRRSPTWCGCGSSGATSGPDEPALLLLCPVKCESYFADNGGRRDQSAALLQWVRQVYQQVIEAVPERGPRRARHPHRLRPGGHHRLRGDPARGVAARPRRAGRAELLRALRGAAARRAVDQGHRGHDDRAVPAAGRGAAQGRAAGGRRRSRTRPRPRRPSPSATRASSATSGTSSAASGSCATTRPGSGRGRRAGRRAGARADRRSWTTWPGATHSERVHQW